MAKIKICNLVLGNVATNTYFVANQVTNEMLLIDPADEPERIDRQVQKMGYKPVAVLLTHGHFDHIMAAGVCRDRYDIPVYAQEQEDAVLKDAQYNLSAKWMCPYTIKADHLLKDQQKLQLAGFCIQILHTPGHTKGSACYYFPEDEALFSGDTLFAQSYGRTDFPTSSMADMKNSICRLLRDLPDTTTVYPGHGEFTSIEVEKRYNPLA